MLLILVAIVVVVLVVRLAKLAVSLLEPPPPGAPPRVAFDSRPRPGRPSRQTGPGLFLKQYGRPMIPVTLEELIKLINLANLAMPEGPQKDEALRVLSRLLIPVPVAIPRPEGRRSQLTLLLVLAVVTASFGVLLRISW